MVDTTRPSAEAKAVEYSLTGNENFIEYLRTLGLRTIDNQPKQAFEIVKTELQKRGF